jgi:hypothetical protein
MKKKQIQNTDPSINFRVSKELKNIIEGKAEEKNLTTSKYLRDLLEKVHSGEYCYKQEVRSKIESFLYSKEFLQLMIWIYRKKTIQKLEVETNDLMAYIKTLKKIEEHLPQNISQEFDKVLNDVLDLKNDNSYSAREKFEFHESWKEHKKINLELVEEFLLKDNYLKQFIDVQGAKRNDFPDLSWMNFSKK